MAEQGSEGQGAQMVWAGGLAVEGGPSGLGMPSLQVLETRGNPFLLEPPGEASPAHPLPELRNNKHVFFQGTEFAVIYYNRNRGESTSFLRKGKPGVLQITGSHGSDTTLQLNHRERKGEKRENAQNRTLPEISYRFTLFELKSKQVFV